MHLNTNQVPSCSENLLDVTCRFFSVKLFPATDFLVQLYNASVQTTISASFFVLLSLPSLPIHPPFPKNNVVSWFHDLLATNRQHGMGNGRGNLVTSLEYKANSSVTLLIKQRTD